MIFGFWFVLDLWCLFVLLVSVVVGCGFCCFVLLLVCNCCFFVSVCLLDYLISCLGLFGFPLIVFSYDCLLCV